GAVDDRPVDEGGDLVGLLTGVVEAGAGPWHALRAIQVDDLRAGAVGIEEGVAYGHRDVERLGRAGVLGQVEVMIQELTETVNHGGQEAAFENVLFLGDDGVADGAGAGPGRGTDDGGRDAVGVGGRRVPQQGDVCAA